MAEPARVRRSARADRARRECSGTCGSRAHFRDEFHPKNGTPSKSVFPPVPAIVSGNVDGLLVDAGVETAGLRGIESHAPHIRRGQTGVAKLPRLAAVLADHDTDSPTCHRDSIGRTWVECQVVDIAADAEVAVALKGDAAIGGSEQAATLARRQP